MTPANSYAPGHRRRSVPCALGTSTRRCLLTGACAHDDHARPILRGRPARRALTSEDDRPSAVHARDDSRRTIDPNTTRAECCEVALDRVPGLSLSVGSAGLAEPLSCDDRGRPRICCLVAVMSVVIFHGHPPTPAPGGELIDRPRALHRVPARGDAVGGTGCLAESCGPDHGTRSAGRHGHRRRPSAKSCARRRRWRAARRKAPRCRRRDGERRDARSCRRGPSTRCRSAKAPVVAGGRVVAAATEDARALRGRARGG
jgi:hypothetical protein